MQYFASLESGSIDVCLFLFQCETLVSAMLTKLAIITNVQSYAETLEALLQYAKHHLSSIMHTLLAQPLPFAQYVHETKLNKLGRRIFLNGEHLVNASYQRKSHFTIMCLISVWCLSRLYFRLVCVCAPKHPLPDFVCFSQRCSGLLA